MGAAGRECSFISRVGPRQQDSDVEDIEADRSRQVPVSESSPEQSYALERDRHLSGGCPDPHLLNAKTMICDAK